MIPRTLQPKAKPKAAPPPAGAAASVERRPIPQGGLTLAVLRDYSDDEIDAELRHLRINHPANFSRHAHINLIINHYAPNNSETDMQRAQPNLEILRRKNFENPYVVSNEVAVQEVAANTGMEVETTRHLLAWSNVVLKA